tara:strand:+ start:496 stop:636 length:141 start_codon:yes stop_codon:yes gene_type:complete
MRKRLFIYKDAYDFLYEEAAQEFVEENKINYKYEMFGERQALVKIL